MNSRTIIQESSLVTAVSFAIVEKDDGKNQRYVKRHIPKKKVKSFPDLERKDIPRS